MKQQNNASESTIANLCPLSGGKAVKATEGKVQSTKIIIE
jgi:hypothetical protein